MRPTCSGATPLTNSLHLRKQRSGLPTSKGTTAARVRRWWSSLYHCHRTPWPSLTCLGSGVDQIMPVREEDYPFSFHVYGCYDLREHLAETGNPYRFGEEPYPGEIEDLISVLDNRREQVAEDLGTEHPLFRLLDASLRASDVEELRVARSASESFHINEYPDLEDEDFEDTTF